MAPPIDPLRRHAAGHYSDHAGFAPDGDYFVSVGYAPMPKKCPYKPGDWVVCHGYSGRPGSPQGPLRWGFRGYVLGGMGSTFVRGVTDDGREWCEHWGRLLPDGTPCPSQMCVCHPQPWRLTPPKPVVKQLGLFDLGAMAPTFTRPALADRTNH